MFNNWGMGLVQPKHTLPTLQLACILLAVINGLGGFRPRLLWGAPDFSPQNFGSVEAVVLAVGTADPCLFQVRQWAVEQHYVVGPCENHSHFQNCSRLVGLVNWQDFVVGFIRLPITMRSRIVVFWD